MTSRPSTSEAAARVAGAGPTEGREAPVELNLDALSPSTAIKAEARRLGFELAGIAPAVTPAGYHDLLDWLDRGYGGEMTYIERRRAAYEHPDRVLESARSVIMLALNYRAEDPRPPGPNEGLVARYAWGERDYHSVIRAKLRQLADFVHGQFPGCRTRGVVDTAPLLERDFARLAGLGWFGKNTMLINTRMGSWLFLAALLVDVELEYDEPQQTAHCGTCTRCLEACPTDAFTSPYVLDARRCISYLTIELRDAIPVELRDGMGQWLFGCDVCQDVCPWNRKAPQAGERSFVPVASLDPADAAALLSLSEDAFEARFQDSPLARPGRAGLLRNAAIVLGNAGDVRAIDALVRALSDAEPIVRGAAAWALGRFEETRATAALKARIPVEDNVEVSSEMRSALSRATHRD